MKPSWLPIALFSLSLSGLLLTPSFGQAPPDEPPAEDLPVEEVPDDEPPQDPGPPPPGAGTPKPRRVRLELRDGGLLKGFLLSHDKGTYVVQTLKGQVRIAEAQVKRVVFPIQPINVDADDMPLGKVMAAITRQTGRTIVVGADAGQERVNLSLRQIPWREAVYVIARMTDCQVEEVGESLYLSKRARVTLSFTNADLRTVLLLMGTYAGRNIVLAPKIRGSITCELKEVGFSESLQALAYACSLELSSKHGGVISVRPQAERPTPPQSRWQSFPQPLPAGAPAPKRISLDLEQVPLADAAEKIGVLVERNILVSPGSKGVVDLSLRNAPWPEAVQLLARQTHCRMRTTSGLVLLEQPPQNALSAKNVPAAAWFRALARVRGKNVIVAPEVNGLLEVNLAHAFLDEAFEQSARAYGYQVAEFGEITVVVGKRYDPSAKPTGVRVSESLTSDPKATPAAAPKLTDKQQEAFKRRVEEVVSAIEAAAMKQDVDAMVVEFQRFRELVNQGKARGSLSRADLLRFKQRLDRFGEIALSLELQIFVQEGNALLAAMTQAIKDKEPRKALVHQAQLEQLAAEMRRQERDVFKRNADALVRRGRQLADEALGTAGAIRTPAGPHRLYLESILWSGPAADRPSVCVILGRVYAEGETYLLPSDDALEGVKIKTISKRHVVLDVRGKDLRLAIE